MATPESRLPEEKSDATAATRASDWSVERAAQLMWDHDIGALPVLGGDGKIAGIYREIARKTAVFVAQKAEDFTAKFPSIKVQNT